MSIQRSNRKARAIVCVLVCMGIATTIMLTSMRRAIRVRRQMRTEIQMEQTRWMLQAATVRAIAMLEKDSDYKGEEWEVGDAFASTEDALIRIKIESDASGQQFVSATSIINADGNPNAATRRSGRWRINR